ncbi:Ankyrin-3-like [Oopsacas minuta]|uniref:Ankyrin-3-like n=1 Tax=Oopsacas minuta TaxID=111878 RepID=A0AAV7JZZ9_9METZ|nr:Ankyrin-3-like [Oopsacas minuta]
MIETKRKYTALELDEEPVSKMDSSNDTMISRDSQDDAPNSIHSPHLLSDPIESNLDEEGYSRVHLLAQDWNREMFEQILESGVDINLRTKKQLLTPLMIAVQAQNTEAVDFILANGGGINDTDVFQNSSLHKAVAVGFIPILQTLANQGADLNAQNRNGTTPLISAAKNQQGGALSILLNYGAAVELTDHGGYTALCYAAWRGLLVSNLLGYNANVNVKSLFGFTPLLLATEEGHCHIVKELLAHGADINAYNRYHNTALHYAVNTGNIEMISILLENGINIKIANNESKTAFRLINRQNVLLKMLEKGVLPDNPGQYGLLHSAAENGFLNEICTMLESEIDVDVKDDNGYTPLMLAANRGRVDVVELFYRNRADVNVRSNRGWTAIMLATKNNDRRMISLLLQNGAILAGSALTNMINQDEKEAYTIETDVFGIAESEELCQFIIAEMEENLTANPNPRIPLYGLITKHYWDLVKYCLNKQISFQPEELTISVEILQQDVNCVLPYEEGYKKFRRNVVRSIWEFCNDEIINSLPIKMWISNHMKEYGNIILCTKLLLYTIFVITLGFLFFSPLHIPTVTNLTNTPLSSVHLIAELFVAVYWFASIISSIIRFVFTYKRYWDVLILSLFSPLAMGRYMFKASLIITGIFVALPFHLIKLFCITPCKSIRVRNRTRYQRDKFRRTFWREFLRQLTRTSSLLFTGVLLNELKIDMLIDPHGEKVGKYRILKAHLYLRFFVLVTSFFKFFSSIYNLLGFFTNICLFGYFILRISSRDDWWIFASPTFLFASLNILHYLSISFLGVYIYVIFRMLTHDLLRFSLLFLIVLISFTGSFFIAILGPVYGNNTIAYSSNNCSPFLLYPWYNVFLTGLRILSERSNILECAFFNNFVNGWAVFILFLFLFFSLVLITNILVAQFVYTYSEARSTAQIAVISKQLEFLIDIQEHSIFSLFDWKKYCFVRTLSISKEHLKVDFPLDYKDLYREESLNTLATINEKLVQHEAYQKKYFSHMRSETHKQLDTHMNEMKQSFLQNQQSLELELKRQKDFLEKELCPLINNMRNGSIDDNSKNSPVYRTGEISASN